MRTTWLITTTTAGVLALGGLAVAGPALADDRAPGTGAVERIAEALAGLVEDGSLTQEQADEVATTLAGSGLAGSGAGHHGGYGGGHHGGQHLAAAAEALDMSEDELRSALDTDGATLAQVAEDRGVAVSDLVDTLVAAEGERIAEAVEEGRLTREEADDRLAELAERVAERVEQPRPERPGPR